MPSVVQDINLGFIDEYSIMIPIRDSIPCHTRPIICWMIMAICISVFIWMQQMPVEIQHQLTYLYGMVPLRYSDLQWANQSGFPLDYGLSFLSNLFLHGGWFHLILNMLFIWIFADNIEDRMGHGWFLGFYLLCGLIATFTQWLFDPQLAMPVIGASGAIAGVLGAYFFLYPYARVVIWFPFLLLPIFFEIPAIAFLGFWVIIQINEATSHLMFNSDTANVAWWAHLGGFIAGAILHPLFLHQSPEQNLS
jgi:membrane associated rhomboid family serine protease